MEKKNKNSVKEPKKALKSIENLHALVKQLKFFYGGNDDFKKHVLKKAIYIEDCLRELSVDKKIDHAKFISTFKHLFNKENQELKEEVIELKEVIKERGEKIKVLVEENKELVEIVIMECEEDET